MTIVKTAVETQYRGKNNKKKEVKVLKGYLNSLSALRYQDI